MKYPLIVRVLQDVFGDKTRRRVTPQEVSARCEELAQAIRKNYEPDLVVAVATGGSVPGELLAQLLHIPIVHLAVRRNINIKRRYSLDPVPLRWAMTIYHHFLFQTVKPAVSGNIEVDVSGRKILIVEDTLHTGATVEVAAAHLMERKAAQVRVASLAYVSERKPDFSVLPRGNYSFPWSKDYANSSSGPPV